MTIAIDFDYTWTEDPGLWVRFYRDAVSLGHRVVMVTARHHPITPEEASRYALPPELQIIYTSGNFKEDVALKAGVKVDVWIDDTPGMIQHIALLPTSPDQAL